MERRIIPEAENRLIILYTLRRLGPCTATQLLQFMVEIDIMNYFTLQLGLCEMEEQGQLVQHAHPLGSLLAPTESGAFTLDTFMSRIPHSRRVQIDEAAPAYRTRFRLEQQTPAECRPMPDGQNCLRLRLMEGESALLDIMLTQPAERSFPLLGKHWEHAAQPVLEAVTARLMSDSALEGEPAPLPEGASLIPTASGDWRLTLVHCIDDVLMTMLISLPSEQLCRLCASHWTENAEELRQFILAELNKPLVD